ncbi:MAG: hypothetical protein ACI9DJ_003478 [Algoriphagus sp.]|jgi:hypothetical protein
MSEVSSVKIILLFKTTKGAHLAFWTKELALSNLVFSIGKLQPDVMIKRFN